MRLLAYIASIFNKPKNMEKPFGKILAGDGNWAFMAEIEGEDIVVSGVRATCFGGSNDKMDSGETASGISTKLTGTMGCALPRCYTGSSSAQKKALGGSPIPAKLPFGTMVEVTSDGETITVPFIDVGPARWTKNGLDLSIAAARKFNPKATANNFEAIINYRIIGGAKYA